MENSKGASPHQASREKACGRLSLLFHIEVHRGQTSHIHCAKFTRDQLPKLMMTTVHIVERPYFFFSQILELFKFVLLSIALCGPLPFCGKDEANDEAVQPQDFGEDQDQDHAHK